MTNYVRVTNANGAPGALDISGPKHLGTMTNIFKATVGSKREQFRAEAHLMTPLEMNRAKRDETLALDNARNVIHAVATERQADLKAVLKQATARIEKAKANAGKQFSDYARLTVAQHDAALEVARAQTPGQVARAWAEAKQSGDPYRIKAMAAEVAGVESRWGRGEEHLSAHRVARDALDVLGKFAVTDEVIEAEAQAAKVQEEIVAHRQELGAMAAELYTGGAMAGPNPLLEMMGEFVIEYGSPLDEMFGRPARVRLAEDVKPGPDTLAEVAAQRGVFETA